MKKGSNLLGSIGLWISASLLIFLLVGTLGNRLLNGRPYSVVKVEGNSMSPALRFGDLIIVTPPTESITADTVITMSVDGAFVTHRLVSEYSGGWPETKGDANDVNDNFEGRNLKIVGIVRMRIPWLGYPFMYIRYLLNRF